MNNALGEAPELFTILSRELRGDAQEFSSKHPISIALALMLVGVLAGGSGVCVWGFTHGMVLVGSDLSPNPLLRHSGEVRDKITVHTPLVAAVTPRIPASLPTGAQSNAITDAPTDGPSNAPTDGPSNRPSNAPTDGPSNAPTKAETEAARTCSPEEMAIEIQDGAFDKGSQAGKWNLESAQWLPSHQSSACGAAFHWFGDVCSDPEWNVLNGTHFLFTGDSVRERLRICRANMGAAMV